ncbi:structural maintenance of chromosomes protein 4-like [Varroa destructor]|uniref:Structural maintenance of chromosomes protein n=1 Tax=Varroa destructor TaxID=109461 RepID=A0A7M7K628_VARDE|nr:structural maintenance of chromosomes protein 4-like [Varroa destructor]XP_022662185.1 structural maintenance of chromosomes protein 4-like [Varroa destructor]XP_022662186.1 structural maintenance of chromosomes protein 4-like [Varroa destructor]
MAASDDSDPEMNSPPSKKRLSEERVAASARRSSKAEEPSSFRALAEPEAASVVEVFANAGGNGESKQSPIGKSADPAAAQQKQVIVSVENQEKETYGSLECPAERSIRESGATEAVMSPSTVTDGLKSPKRRCAVGGSVTENQPRRSRASAEMAQNTQQQQTQQQNQLNESAKLQQQSVQRARATSQKTVDEVFAGCERDEDGGIKIGNIYIPPPPPPACTFEAIGPRLIISKIENRYFKSYGKHVIIGPLHKNYSGIVGPNGSGKSNVIDSMLFVFGYRSKKVRAQKVSNLIHNCDMHRDIRSCTVDVHFETIIDNEDKFEIVPGSKLVIGRTAFRDNSSHYTLNGRQVSQKEVTKILRQNGIDLEHDRFLILQGEVEQISMMKPKSESENDDGMLEYLEDIIGTNRYKEPIEAFVKNVDALQEERNAALDRVNMAEQDMLAKKELRDEAIDFLRLCNDMTRCDQQLYEIARCDEKEKKFGIEKQLDQAKATVEKIKKQMTEFLEENKRLTDAHKALCREEAEVLKQGETLQAQYTELETKDIKCREEIKHAKTAIKKLEKDQETQSKKIEKLKSDAIKLPEEKAAAEEAAKELIEEVANLEADLHSRMEDLNKQVSPIQEEKSTLEKNLLELQRAVNTAKSAFSMAQSELELMTSSSRTEQRKLEERERALEEAQKKLQAKEEQVSKSKEALPSLKEAYEKVRHDLETVDREYEECRANYNSSRIKLEEMRSTNTATRTNNRLLDALMNEKRKGGALSGIIGRLGDLGGIDKEYDVAISMACGLLDSIVVDTTSTAKECIKYLQKHNLGKSNFLALEKMNHLIGQAKQSIRTPENAPRLIDLVQLSDPAYLGVFYYALRDTLYVHDIDSATRVGLGGVQRFRVVTNKGEIVDPSGTLTGGGGRTYGGKMGRKAKLDTSISDSEISALTSQVAEMESRMTILATRKDDTGRQLSQKKKELDQVIQMDQKVSLEVSALVEEIRSLEGRIKMQQKSVAEKTVDPVKLQQQETRVAETRQAYEEAEKSTEADRKAVETLDKKINKIKEERIGNVKNKLEKAQRSLKEVEAKKTQCQVGINNSERMLVQAERKLADIAAEMATVQERRQKARELYDDLANQAQSINEQLEKANALKEELSGRVAASARGLHDFNKQEGVLKIKQQEQKNIVKDLEKDHDQCCRVIEGCIRKIKALRLEIIDEGDDEDAVASSDEAATLLPELTEEEVHKLDADSIEREKVRLSEIKKTMKPTLGSIAEYKAKMSHYKKLSGVYLDKQQTLERHKSYLQALKKARLQEFLTGFKIITQKVKEMYRTITLGGDADLELVDSLDPFSEGIAFSVRPPRKTWKNISNLSGGEKTLSSLSLVFALHYYKPAPFYVMDEIDAALDHKNVSIIANYINERTRNTQFIIISLREEMFSLARKLTGIYKPYNDTNTLTLDIEHCLIGMASERDKENDPPAVTAVDT